MEATQLKLYVDDGSQPSRACMIFCEINNINAEIIPIRLAKMDHKSPDFLKVNPIGQVPALQDGDFFLQEGNAILKYIAVTRKVDDHWYPSCPKKRAKVDAVMDWHHCFLRPGAAP
mmetsp:Transcript_21789/g.19311  ORF Transcript_21789/g.19311 Transcript_21789/m.19311 type:complete len:116 (+) Transcript_21789:18-365(+)